MLEPARRGASPHDVEEVVGLDVRPDARVTQNLHRVLQFVSRSPRPGHSHGPCGDSPESAARDSAPRPGPMGGGTHVRCVRSSPSSTYDDAVRRIDGLDEAGAAWARPRSLARWRRRCVGCGTGPGHPCASSCPSVGWTTATERTTMRPPRVPTTQDGAMSRESWRSSPRTTRTVLASQGGTERRNRAGGDEEGARLAAARDGGPGAPGTGSSARLDSGSRGR